MSISKQVRFLEEGLERRYRQEIERELRPDVTGIRVENLTCYSTSDSWENYFFPISIFKTGKELGLILPFRGLIFHSIPEGRIGNNDDTKILEALAEVSNRRGYTLRYNKYAWQHEPIIEGLKTGELYSLRAKVAP